MEKSQLRTILLALASELDAGADTSPAMEKALGQLSEPASPKVEPPKKTHPLQIAVKEEDTAQIRALYGIISGSKVLLQRQEVLLLALIEELKGYYNVPSEVGYDLNLASKDGEVTCFIREDIFENVSKTVQAVSDPPKEPGD